MFFRFSGFSEFSGGAKDDTYIRLVEAHILEIKGSVAHVHSERCGHRGHSDGGDDGGQWDGKGWDCGGGGDQMMGNGCGQEVLFG
jgi:hypothetical protein